MNSVTSVIIKNSKRQEKKNTFREKMLSFIAFSIVFLSLSISMIGISIYIVNKLKVINQEFTYLSILLLMNFLILFAKSIFESINSLYFSKDLKILLKMPIKSKDLVHGKLINMIASEYQMEFIMLAIPMIVYGILTNCNLVFYLYSLIILIIIPIIPIVITSTVISIIMRFTNLMKNKTYAMYTAIILTILVVGILTPGGGNIQISSISDFRAGVFQTNGIAEGIANQSIFVKTIMDILTNYEKIEAFKNLALYVLSSLGLYAICLYVIQSVYLKGAIGTTINSRKERENRNLSLSDFETSNKSKSYLKKELKILARTPIFFIQCLLIPVIYPLAIFLVFVSAVVLSKMLGVDIIEKFMGMINMPRGQAIFLGVGDVFFMMNFCSIIGVSKDSKSSILIKSIPMDLYKQFRLRILIGQTVNMFSGFIITFAYWYATNNILLTIIVFAILVLMDELGEKVKLLIDLEKPKINWDNEYTMMKEHTNVMYVLFYTLLMLGILFVISLITKTKVVYLILVLVMYLILNIVSSKFIKNNKNKIFSKIY